MPPPVMPQPVVQAPPPPAFVPASPSPVENARVNGGGNSSVDVSAAGPPSGGDEEGEETVEELEAKLEALKRRRAASSAPPQLWSNTFVPVVESFAIPVGYPALPAVDPSGVPDSAYGTEVEVVTEAEPEDDPDIPSSQPRSPPEDPVGDTSPSEMDELPAKGKFISSMKTIWWGSVL